MEPEGGSLSDCKEEGKCVRVAAEYASTGSAPDEEIGKACLLPRMRTSPGWVYKYSLYDCQTYPNV